MFQIYKLWLVIFMFTLGKVHAISIPFKTEILSIFRYNCANTDSASLNSQYDYGFPIDLTQYNDDIVIRVLADDKETRNKILAHNLGAINYSVWGKSNIHKTIDIQIRVLDLMKLRKILPNIEYSILIEDLKKKIIESYPQDYKRPKMNLQSEYEHDSTETIVNEMKINPTSELFFKEYRPLETIYAWLDLVKESFPQLVDIEEIGKTYEGRPYKIVHISAPNDRIGHDKRKTVVINGAVHSREWISISSALYSIYALVTFYDNNPDLHDLLSQLDFLIIPVPNPDGYVYSWTHDRLWRKNRQATSVPNCYGIDIDHSYDNHWTKSSDWACGEEYSGEYPLEASEANIWTNYINHTNNNHELFGFIDLHSYSQEVLYPYAFSCSEKPRDEENLIELAYGISKAVRMQSGEYYDVLPACIDKDVDLLPDLGSGSGLDYMYHEKAYWAYQIKLRDSGNHGFLLPNKYIVPVGEETVAALKYFCFFILSNE